MEEQEMMKQTHKSMLLWYLSPQIAIMYARVLELYIATRICAWQ